MNDIESFVSARLLIYSKEAVFDKVWASMLLKKGSKIHPMDNSILTTRCESITAIYSPAHSCAGKSVNPLTPLAVAQVVTRWFIDIVDSLSPIQKRALLSVPNVLGGAPIFLSDQIMVRAENDHLTNAVSYLRFLARTEPQHVSWILAFLNQPMQTRPSSVRLLSDIYSLPIKAPKRAFEVIQGFISRRITRLVKDHDLREILKITSDKDRRYFCNQLLSVRPSYIKILSAVYMASYFALRDDLVAIFENTQTIFECLSLGSGKDAAKRALQRAADQDTLWIRWFCKICSGLTTRWVTLQRLLDSRPTQLSQELWNSSWGLEIIGVTYPHYTEVIELATPRWEFLTQDQRERYFLGVRDQLINQSPDTSDHFASGVSDFHPFLGQSTADKLEKLNLEPDRMGPTVARMASLLDIYAFTNVYGSNFNTNVIQPVLDCYSNIPSVHLVPFAPTMLSGSSTHRLRARSWRMQVSPNEKPNRYQLVRMESSTHIKLRGDQFDYNINFLHLYSLQVNTMLFEMMISPRSLLPPKWYFITTTCPGCIMVVDDAPLIAPQQLDIRVPLPGNPYLQLTAAEVDTLLLAVEQAVEGRVMTLARQDPLMDPSLHIGIKVELLCLFQNQEKITLKRPTFMFNQQ